MKLIFLALTLLFIGFPAFASDCESVLVKDVTNQLWQEAVTAEKNITAMRITSKVILSSALEKTPIVESFLSQLGINQNKSNIDQIKQLILANLDPLSDFIHFGVIMKIPSLPISSQLQVSNQELVNLFNESQMQNQLMEMSRQILLQNQEYFPIILKKILSDLDQEFDGMLNAMRQQGMTHEELYKFKHDFMEINNYVAVKLHEVKNEKLNYSFLPLKEVLDPLIKKPIGFIH
ncbi:MAG: hypothetical protein KDD58_00645 [Bdellovibrionales bacterium]|nr:hypothetical protein [Bdellovibrionales bacterium]